MFLVIQTLLILIKVRLKFAFQKYFVQRKKKKASQRHAQKKLTNLTSLNLISQHKRQSQILTKKT